MARTQGTSARTQRLITVVAMCLLALTSALAIGRVFVGTASTYEMVVVALASALLACAMERRNLLLATAVSALGMLIAIGIFVFPETTWFGLPTLETISAAVRAAGLIGEQARIQVAPTAPLPPLLLAALTGTWAAIFSAHALAFRAGSPLLALLPPVALVAFADTVLEDVVRPVYGVAFLVAATAVVFADSLRRVQGWGPVWASPGRAARLTSTAGKGARRVAAATVAVAMVSPLLIPGFGSKAILDFSSRNEDQVRIDPLVSVQSQLDRDEPIEVFEVKTQEPVYWRMVALPTFDGTSWKPEEEPVAIDVGPDTPLVTNAQPNPALVGDSQTVPVSFRTASDLALPWLPVPYLPVSTNVLADDLRWDPEGGSLLLSEPIDSATSYTVDAQLVRPTPDALREEEIDTSPETARYTQLPSDFPQGITDLAEAWTADALTPYDEVIAIQQRFNGEGSEFTVRPDRGAAQRLQRAARLPREHPEGVLPAVRGVDGRDAAHRSASRPGWPWGSPPGPSTTNPTACASRPRTPTPGSRCCSPATAGSPSNPRLAARTSPPTRTPTPRSANARWTRTATASLRESQGAR